jgi:predicted ATPase
MRINFLNLKQGEPVELAHKISVFVGPNNSGKSQTLKDIRLLMDRPQANSKPVILKNDTTCFEIPDIKTIKNDIPFIASRTNVDHYTFEGIRSNLSEKNAFDIHKSQLESYDDRPDEQKRSMFFSWFGKSYIALMDAETRLRLSSETSSFNPSEEKPQNLLQSLFKSTEIEKILRISFKEAFKQDIKLDVSQLQKICLRVGNDVNQIPDDPRMAYTVANGIPKIDSQGDGYRSFAGIVIGLLICKKRIILLDEPEAFLHPAQAFFLGKWIGENCASLGSQLLICTHSSNFLSGILTGTKDLGIFRLQRVENRTFYNRLTPDVANQLIGNPILSSQRVIEGIFHSGVVICEADADRAIYQSVAAICHNSNREVLFIHAHNKQTLALVAGVLKQTRTPVAVVADIDILRPKKDIDDVYKVLTGIDMPAELKAKQLQLNDFVESRPEEETLQELKNNVSELIQQLEERKHTFEGARSALSRIQRETSKWSAIKRNGVDALPAEEKENALKLIAELAKVGLFVVPVGELEGWIDLGTHKKNKWIVPALDAINSRNTPPDLSGFVGGILKYFN